MNFVELTEADSDKVFINLDHVSAMRRELDVMGQVLTMLIFKDDDRRFFVRESPQDILILAKNQKINK